MEDDVDENEKTCQKAGVYIGNQLERWQRLSKELHIDDTAIAKLLLDTYCFCF